MSEKRRLVIDTSTLIGALLRPASAPRQAFMAAVSGFELCASEATLTELRDVLQRGKFDRYAPLDTRLEFLALVSQHSRLIEVDKTMERRTSGTCRDVEDDKFLALALACCATVIVSSDADLLALHPWQGVQIVTAREFLELAQA